MTSFHRTYYTLALLMGVLLLVQPAHADGWLQIRGRGYYKVGYRMVRATHYYEPNGNRIQIPTLGDYTVSFYGEYGLTDGITVLAYVPFFERITLNQQIGQTSGFVFSEGDAVSGLADAIVGARFGLIRQGATVLSATVKLGLPLGNDDQPNGLLTGDGEFNQTIALETGHSFYPIPAYAIASVGFNQRTKGFSDEFVYTLEAGYTVAERFTIAAKVRGVESFKNGDPTVGGQRGFNGNDQRYLAYGVEVIYTHHDTYGLSVGFEGATRAQNVLSAVAFSAGLFVKL